LHVNRKNASEIALPGACIVDMDSQADTLTMDDITWLQSNNTATKKKENTCS